MVAQAGDGSEPIDSGAHGGRGIGVTVKAGLTIGAGWRQVTMTAGFSR